MIKTTEQRLAEIESNMDEMVNSTRRVLARREKAARLVRARAALASYYVGGVGEKVLDDYRDGNVRKVFIG